ncbi:MAG: penicillin-binding protein 2 [Candidatus Omnitrophota bacterium]|nr:MAG: penicillin-binding protein 2 [Candidatus Omnitrophota bacterium]
MGQNLIRRIYLGGFLLLVFSLFYYQIVKGDYYLERARNNYVRIIPLESIRGTIFDKNSVPLAYDKASFNIAVVPYEIQDKKNYLFNELAGFSGYDANLLHSNYEKRKANIFSPVDIILDVDKMKALKIKEKFGEDILINPQPTRFYPYPYESAHILGYVKKAVSSFQSLKKYGYTPAERIGFGGIEQYYDAYLKGDNGGDLIEVDAEGKMVGFLGERLPQKGRDIYLTIDSRIQKYAYNAMGKKRGTIILLDSMKGEVLSLVSLPSFDPNDFIKGRNIKKLLAGDDKPLINRASQATYPLGSTFKPIVSVAALDSKKATPSTTFNCGGTFNLGMASFRCAHTHDQENLYDALIHSCNIYFYNLGLIIGSQTMARWAKKFGLDSDTEIDLPYERKGLVPSPLWKSKEFRTTWFKGDTVNFSIGQGFIEVTPLENLIAFNVFASGGYLIKPYILKKVDATDSTLSAKSYLGIPQDSLNAVREGLRGAVRKEDGTSYYLKKLNLKIAGKTGTAQTYGKSHGWFLGFFPYDDPKYTICTFLENCGSSFYAVKASYDFLKSLKEQELL